MRRAQAGPARLCIVGTGRRAALYLRIAHALPDRFTVVGVTSRDPARRAEVQTTWGVPVAADAGAMINDTQPDFTVVAVPPLASASVLTALVEAGRPILAETPPATDLDDLDPLCRLVDSGAMIQVAEQVRFRPMHAARAAIIAAGRLGTVSQADVSVAHGYHGVNLIRSYLGVGRTDVRIEARAFVAPIVYGPVRPPATELIHPGSREVTGVYMTDERRVIGRLGFPGHMGIYDFTFDQYFTATRSEHVLIRGDRGEIRDADVRHLADDGTVVDARLRRLDGGRGDDLDEYSHKGVLLGDEWVYRSPFPEARLSDDEIAVASCLSRMAEHVAGGPEFSSLRDAAHDHHLGLMIERSASTGTAIEVAARY